MFPELYIMRHGQTTWNAEGRMQGKLNAPLTALGRDQAQRQADLLAHVDLTGFDVLCSPQGRAVETAAIALARQVPLIRTDDRLCEIGVGEWQGRLRTNIAGYDAADDTPDGPLQLYDTAQRGEGFAALRSRCEGFLADLTKPSVLITHGITSRMLRCVVLGLDADRIGTLPGGQGVVFHLRDGVQVQLG